MIVLTVLFAVEMPLNAEEILIAILGFTNLDLIETEWLTSFIFNFEESEPFNDRFSEAGYQTSNFIIELGLIFFIAVAFLIFVSFNKLVKLCSKKCQNAKIKTLMVKYKPFSKSLACCLYFCLPAAFTSTRLLTLLLLWSNSWRIREKASS